MYKLKVKNAQQNVRLTLGILRQSQAVLHASAFFPVGRLRRPRPSAGNANRWAIPRAIEKGEVKWQY